MVFVFVFVCLRANVSKMSFSEMEGGWERALRGKRRKCSAFEMMFKKNLLDANNIEKKKKEKKSIFKLGDFRKDAEREDDTVVDIAAYRFVGFSLNFQQTTKKDFMFVWHLNIHASIYSLKFWTLHMSDKQERVRAV